MILEYKYISFFCDHIESASIVQLTRPGNLIFEEGLCIPNRDFDLPYLATTAYAPLEPSAARHENTVHATHGYFMPIVLVGL